MKKIVVIILLFLCIACNNSKIEKNSEKSDLKEETLILSMKSYVNAVEQAYLEKILNEGDISRNNTYYLIESKKIESKDKKTILDISIHGNLPDTFDKGEIILDQEGHVKLAKLIFDSRYVTYCNENKVLISKEQYMLCK